MTRGSKPYRRNPGADPSTTLAPPSALPLANYLGAGEGNFISSGRLFQIWRPSNSASAHQAYGIKAGRRLGGRCAAGNRDQTGTGRLERVPTMNYNRPSTLGAIPSHSQAEPPVRFHKLLLLGRISQGFRRFRSDLGKFGWGGLHHPDIQNHRLPPHANLRPPATATIIHYAITGMLPLQSKKEMLRSDRR